MDPDSFISVATGNHHAVFPFIYNATRVVCVITAGILLLLTAALAAIRAALMSLSIDEVKSWENDHNPAHRRIIRLLADPNKLLATIQTAQVLIKIAILTLAAYAVFAATPAIHVPTAGMKIAIIAVISLLLLTFGETIPRIYASQNPVKVLLRLTFLLPPLQKVFYPMASLMASAASAARRQAMKKQPISIDDISSALEKTSEDSETSENILKGIVEFGNIDVHSIMTPRTAVEAIDITAGMTELLEKINEWGYSRIPVYDGAPDNIRGILYVKDLLPFIDESDSFHWQKLIRNAYFVPENKKIDDLLSEFQNMKMHMAVIIDEYGCMVGVVTLEDILEEIVGEIADESDDDEQDYVQIDNHTWLFDAKALLHDFARVMQLNEADFDGVRGEADTLAGLILEMKGEIPKKGDSVEHLNISFIVEAADNRRIHQIKVIVHEK